MSPILAATTGVEHVADLVAYLLAGADVVMTTLALLRHGPKHAQVLLDGLEDWMQRKEFDSVDAMRGLLATPVEEICGKATPMKTRRRNTRNTPTSGQARPMSTLV